MNLEIKSQLIKHHFHGTLTGKIWETPHTLSPKFAAHPTQGPYYIDSHTFDWCLPLKPFLSNRWSGDTIESFWCILVMSSPLILATTPRFHRRKAVEVPIGGGHLCGCHQKTCSVATLVVQPPDAFSTESDPELSFRHKRQIRAAGPRRRHVDQVYLTSLLITGDSPLNGNVTSGSSVTGRGSSKHVRF